MTLTLVHSREHACHNAPMTWQPAGHHFYCAVCHRKEAPSEYGIAKQLLEKDGVFLTEAEGEQVDQPEPA